MPVEVGKGEDAHAGGKRGRDGEEILIMPIYMGQSILFDRSSLLLLPSSFPLCSSLPPSLDRDDHRPE